MKLRALYDFVRHEPAKSLAWGLIILMLVFIGLSLRLLIIGNPSLDIKPVKIAEINRQKIDEQAPVLKVSLFGTYMPAVSEVTIQQSSLDLEVVGILYSTDEKNSQVIIRSAQGQEALYAIHDTLAGGVVIKQINPRGIVILHHGALEALSIKKDPLNFESPSEPLLKE